ncbi:hypothetical protein NFI96_009649 [Prochilodus magdalenae]|nr:hypothetical protein NFI96_009649 [Prochilodus magdalenae]
MLVPAWCSRLPMEAHQLLAGASEAPPETSREESRDSQATFRSLSHGALKTTSPGRPGDIECGEDPESPGRHTNCDYEQRLALPAGLAAHGDARQRQPGTSCGDGGVQAAPLLDPTACPLQEDIGHLHRLKNSACKITTS